MFILWIDKVYFLWNKMRVNVSKWPQCFSYNKISASSPNQVGHFIIWNLKNFSWTTHESIKWCYLVKNFLSVVGITWKLLCSFVFNLLLVCLRMREWRRHMKRNLWSCLERNHNTWLVIIPWRSQKVLIRPWSSSLELGVHRRPTSFKHSHQM